MQCPHLPVIVMSVVISDDHPIYFGPCIGKHFERRRGNVRDATGVDCQIVGGMVTKSRHQLLRGQGQMHIITMADNNFCTFINKRGIYNKHFDIYMLLP